MGVEWGRNSAILQSIIDGTEYTDPPQSHIEELLIELKQIIESGGGGVEDYGGLTGKPKINNATLESGNNTIADLGLQAALTFDNSPTENSTNPVKSGGVFTAVKTVDDKLYSTIAGKTLNAHGSMALDSTVDLDDIKTSGFYTASSCTHSPFTAAALIVCGVDANNCFQLAANIATGEIQTRVLTSGTWGAWKESNNIIHS